MKPKRTCPEAYPCDLTRRGFLGQALTASAAGLAALSFEEKCLAESPGAVSAPTTPAVNMSTGRIGKLEISRLICGGNLISGYAHARDLVYVSDLLRHYFTDERILDTWAICEQHGINAMIINPSDRRAVALFRRYQKERQGRMLWLAQLSPDYETLATEVRQAVADGASAVFLVGNLGDRWTFDGQVDRIGRFVEQVRQQGVPAGVAGHSLDMVQAVEAAKIPTDFYMKTLHNTEYWSRRRPDQSKPVIENWGVDNYYDMEPAKTIAFMQKVEKPWIAYKVLAAGAIRPRIGINYAFENGADFACVGMFDFQVAEDVGIAEAIIAQLPDRRRAWCA